MRHQRVERQVGPRYKGSFLMSLNVRSVFEAHVCLIPSFRVWNFRSMRVVEDSQYVRCS